MFRSLSGSLGFSLVGGFDKDIGFFVLVYVKFVVMEILVVKDGRLK